MNKFNLGVSTSTTQSKRGASRGCSYARGFLVKIVIASVSRWLDCIVRSSPAKVDMAATERSQRKSIDDKTRVREGGGTKGVRLIYYKVRSRKYSIGE